jgi:hypothetical protein
MKYWKILIILTVIFSVVGTAYAEQNVVLEIKGMSCKL